MEMHPVSDVIAEASKTTETKRLIVFFITVPPPVIEREAATAVAGIPRSLYGRFSESMSHVCCSVAVLQSHFRDSVQSTWEPISVMWDYPGFRQEVQITRALNKAQKSFAAWNPRVR